MEIPALIGPSFQNHKLNVQHERDGKNEGTDRKGGMSDTGQWKWQ